MICKIRTSIAIVTITVVIVASVVFLLLPNALAEEDTITTDDRQRRGNLIKRRLAIAVGRRFLRNGVPVTLEGEVYVVERVILVLDVEGDKVNVIMPNRWTINGETKNKQDLFDEDVFAVGDEVIIESLKLELVKESHTVNSYFAYSIHCDGTTASALLPVNIEVG